MRTSYRDGRGNEVRLGNRLGVGGEGAVFEIQGHSNWVAKIYHEPAPPEKAAKLASMAKHASPALLKFAAWPRAVLHEPGISESIGIVMPRVKDARPIHELYSPAQRKIHFPKADWHFLIRTAFNCAAAFATLHEHGIVVGDVNQGNVLVSSRATGTFIDCDSFQISENGRIYLCRVGVPHFTPPELHAANLGEVIRSTNHDGFGLAVLIFHLMFMGRHPFAGRFSGTGDMPIERAICERRFAYGARARALQMEPPPDAITMSDIPREVAQLFERAFHGHQRPTAIEWASILARLEKHLCKCDDDPGHSYFSRLPSCPWCRIFGGGGPNFFISVTVNALVGHGGAIDVREIWQQIQQIPLPSHVIGQFSQSAHANLKPRPLPEGVEGQNAFRSFVGWIAGLSIFLIVIGLLIPDTAIFGILFTMVFGVWWLVLRETSPTRQLQKERRAVLRTAEARLQAANSNLQAASSNHDGRFRERLAYFRSVYEGLETLRQKKDAELRDLHNNLRASQLKDHLERYFIANAGIRGIGPGRVSSLYSYGIETAADLTPRALERVPGFGQVYTQRLLNWRRQIEAGFRFEPGKGVSPAEVQAVEAKYLHARVQGERAIRQGPAVLKQIVSAAKADAERGARLVTSLKREVEQARLDLTVF